MHCYKLTIAYDGTHYSGWQIQPNAVTVQQILQEVLGKLLKKDKVAVAGSGRTDAGVHAKGQTAHFLSEQPLDTFRLLASINGLLPKDIRLKKIEAAVPGFHAQYDAIGKEYHYHVHLERVMDPIHRLYRWHFLHKIDKKLLQEAICLFPGKHDFTSFANDAHSGAASRDPTRTLYRLDLKETEGGILLEFEGDGFLYKMVRNIVGTLMAVASFKRPIEDIPLIFAAKNRRMASRAAPSHGLFLMKVHYPIPK
jgi:tRNA pseudouridine38-40 synthase